MLDIFKDIESIIKARYPIIYLTSYEEDRVLENLGISTKNNNKEMYTWSITEGLHDYHAKEGDIIDLEAFHDPIDILTHINQSDENAIYILKDFHSFLEDFTIIRKLRDLFADLKTTSKNIIILSPFLRLPNELNKEITVIDIPLPTTNEFLELLDGIKKTNPNLIKLDDKEIKKLARATHGLTISEAENVISKAIVCQKKLTLGALSFILNEKKQIVRKSGILEFYPSNLKMSELGGANGLKNWLSQRGNALFSSKAKKFGLPSPKGVLLLGPPGTGKSLTAKIISNSWSLPLLKLDFGKVFAGLVGSSEENMRQALKTAEGLSPCVLWVDEIEKSLAGGKQGSGDGGTAARVFGSLLTWMQEKKTTVFVVATANDITKLPPELMRKGRFDEIFFLDLPNEDDRKDIFSIHLKNKKRDPSKYDIDQLAHTTEDYTGAEIEQVVIEALFIAYNNRRDLKQEDLTISINNTIPLAKTYKEDLNKLREWAEFRARKAS